MWKFIKRQFGTKTGKFALSIILGALTNIPVIGALVPAITEYVTQVATPETAVVAALAMALRDRDIKKDGGPAPK